MPASEIFAAHLSEALPALDISSLSTTHSPSPASPDERPGPDHSVHHGLAPTTSLTTYTPLPESNIAQPFPLPSSAPAPLPTPAPDPLPDFSLNFAASALPSADLALPASPIVKNALNLRLPSFAALGIANPHPDRVTLSSTDPFPPLGAGPLSKPEDPLHALSPLRAKSHHFGGSSRAPQSPEATRPQLEHKVPTVTPPTDPGTFNWGSFVNTRTAGVGSPPRSDPGGSPIINTAAGPSSARPAGTNPLSVADLSDALGMAAWIETVKSTITSDFQSQHSDSVKILSHALPCPSLTGHLFGQIVVSVHEKTPTPTAWINVFHAVPGRYTLSDLPKSPPSTPGPAVGGDEYFTSKIFDSAVAVADYQLDSKLLPPSPRPVVPPGSVNVSIVERFIPPTNVNEFSEMFKLNGRSLLYDRLVELSPKDGLLLFIYPTRVGGKTFMNDYLGPILDPLLRTVTVVHDLSSDLGKSLGRMVAVEHLPEYNTLHAEMKSVCHRLNETPSNLSACSEPQATYSIIHASKEEMVLERDAWASDWWIKQEKSRVRELVTKFFRKKLPSSELTPTNLIQEILDGVAHREYQPATRPRGVEVGVFIVKKSCCPS